MSDHPGELDALPLADLLDPDSAATKLELRHALGLAWGEVLRLREVGSVGDLTARHLGGYVSIKGGPPALLIAMRKPLPGELRVALFVSTYGADPASTDYLPLDTPCEAM